jgi:hypothetical protein
MVFSSYQYPMWKLQTRGARGTPFEELGSFASIESAAEAISKMESVANGWIFFRVAVYTLNEVPTSDADALSLLSYQGRTHYYELSRDAN